MTKFVKNTNKNYKYLKNKRFTLTREQHKNNQKKLSQKKAFEIMSDHMRKTQKVLKESKNNMKMTNL